MKLEFAKYERSATLETLGSVVDQIGSDGKLSLIPRNFKDSGKRVVIVLEKKNGQSCMVTCSKQVSDGLRDKSIQLGQLLNFELLYGEEEVPYISLPGGGLITVAVKDLKAKDWEPTAVSHEDLIAL